MEVLYHIRPYFLGISPYIGLIYGRYLHFRILKFPLKTVHINPLTPIDLAKISIQLRMVGAARRLAVQLQQLQPNGGPIVSEYQDQW